MFFFKTQVDPVIQQKRNFHIQQKLNVKKRPSLEDLSQKITAPQFPYISAPPILSISQPPPKDNVNENSLTQKFNDATTSQISKPTVSDFDVMGFIFKQQMKFQTEQDVAFERQQRRKAENQRRFQEMILKNFKQN